MSYCRWSSMDFRCDLYIYADVSGGYTCHVAGGRRVFDEREPPAPRWEDLSEENAREWTEAYNRHLRYVSETPVVDIELEHVGETFNLPTGAEMAELVRRLRALGYVCPDDLEEELESEIDEDE